MPYQRPTVLMCARTQSAIADGICAFDHRIQPVRMQWDSFESGNPDFIIQQPELIRRADVVFIADASTPTHVIEQWAVLCALQTYGAHSLTIYIPYFPGTLDRIDVPGRVVWAKSVARLFSNIPMLHGTGPARIVIFDIHAEQELFFFADTVATDCQSAILHMADSIGIEWPIDAVAFPDEGAYKRFKRYFPNLPHIICEKRRGEGDQRTVHVKEGDPAGKNILIVDDLIISGGTLGKCAEVMIHMGAREVRAASPHLVVPKLAIKRFTKNGPIKVLYVSDSIPTDELSGSDGTIQVISLDRHIHLDIKLNVGN